MGYHVLLHEQTYTKAADYLEALQNGDCEAGAHLGSILNDGDWRSRTVQGLIEYLVNSKRPQIFAESEVVGNGQDWNQRELSILGDISIGVPVTVYDNGLHQNPMVYAAPFEATLSVMTGVDGTYNSETNRYEPRGEYEEWLDVVRQNNCQIRVRDNLYIFRELKEELRLQRIEGE